MTWTSKVSNILKTKATSFLSGQITNAAGNLISGFAGGAKTAKLAANLANKSPLDIDKSPTSHLSAQNDPFKYGQLYYPQETQNLGEGHYIIFDTIYNQTTVKNAFASKDSKLYKEVLGSANQRLGEVQRAADDKRLSTLKSQGYLSDKAKSLVSTASSGSTKNFGETHTYLGESIILYTPPMVKFDYKSSYEQAETKNLATLQRSLGDAYNNIKSFFTDVDGNGKSYDSKFLTDMMADLTKTGGVLGRQVLSGALEVAFPGAAGFFTKQTGKAINPRMELAFQSVPFRSFSFSFDFAPKNKDEVTMVNKIIQKFKFHMLPDISDERYLVTPSEFQIMYMYRDKANMYLPKISRCVLTDMSVDYSPEGVFHTFKADDQGAMPVLSKLTLTFTETEIMTKQTAMDGF